MVVPLINAIAIPMITEIVMPIITERPLAMYELFLLILPSSILPSRKFVPAYRIKLDYLKLVYILIVSINSIPIHKML